MTADSYDEHRPIPHLRSRSARSIQRYCDVMGAVSYLPYTHSKTEAPVAIWNARHLVIDHSTGVNVTCQIQRPNGLWYKLAVRSDFHPDEPGRDLVPTTARYISAALTNLSPLPEGYVWGSCPDNTDQAGPRNLACASVVMTSAAAVAALLAARRYVKRHQIQTPRTGV